MPALTTVPVFKCRGCGQKLVHATHVHAINEKFLTEMVANLAKLAKCDYCKAMEQYRVRNPGAVPYYFNSEIISNDKRITTQQIAGGIDLEKWKAGVSQEED